MTTEHQDGAIHVIGGGLAGSEAAFQIAQRGVPVILHEMRPVRMTDAHQTEGLQNSFAPTVFVRMMHRPMLSVCCMPKCA